MREVTARGAKDLRAEPVATAYERGRVSHVLGAALSSLEDTLTTWEPPTSERSSHDSPGDLDALVHGVVELLGLADNAVDNTVGFGGLAEMNKKLVQPTAQAPVSQSYARALIVPGGSGGRI